MRVHRQSSAILCAIRTRRVIITEGNYGSLNGLLGVENPHRELCILWVLISQSFISCYLLGTTQKRLIEHKFIPVPAGPQTQTAGQTEFISSSNNIFNIFFHNFSITLHTRFIHESCTAQVQFCEATMPAKFQFLFMNFILLFHVGSCSAVNASCEARLKQVEASSVAYEIQVLVAFKQIFQEQQSCLPCPKCDTKVLARMKKDKAELEHRIERRTNNLISGRLLSTI